MLKIGITGGIGSGKTTACKIFDLLGVKVYYADNRGKYLLQYNSKVIEKVKYLFGEEIYDDSGTINRPKLAGIVFKDKEKLKALEAIIHPAVKDDYENWVLENKHEPYLLKEAALLFEAGSYKDLDKIIVITAPKEIRAARVVKRDSTSLQSVMERMEHQWPEEKKAEMADFILKNDNESLLIPQIIELHKKLVLSNE